MNSNLCTPDGVALKRTTINTAVFRLFFIFVVGLLLSRTMGAPASPRLFNGVNPEIDTNKEIKTFFMRTKNEKVLEILEDGTVRGSDCANSPTRYSLLESGSHCHSTRNVLMVTLFGKAAERFLCIHKNGTVYATKRENFSEDDCGFNVILDSRGSELYPRGKYKHAVHGRPPPSGKGLRRYQLALTCSNVAMSIYTGRDRRKLINDTLFIEEKVDAKVESLNESCDVRTTKKCKHNHWCPEFYDVKGRTYVKFCRRVVKNFFSATLRDFRLFHKRDCWNVLKKVRLCRERRTNRHSGQTRRRRRRHHHGPSRGKRSDQVVDFDKILPRCVPT